MKFGLIAIAVILIGFYFKDNNPPIVTYTLATVSLVAGTLINLIKIPE